MKKIIIFTLVFVFSYILFHQYRHFYTADNLTFTVWKRWGGRGYIMPYRYWGFSPPKDNYIDISNIGSLSVFIINDSTFIFYSDRYNDVKFNFSDYAYKHYPYPYDLEGVHNYGKLYANDAEKYPCIYFSVREPYIKLYIKEKE